MTSYGKKTNPMQIKRKQVVEGVVGGGARYRGL